MTHLLDVNLLVALAWPTHVHHSAAHSWFGRRPGRWATCPITRLGFARVSSNRAAIPDAVSPGEALDMLGLISDLPGHELWIEGLDAATERTALARLQILGPKQLTDAYLLAVACARGQRLATLDHRMRGLVRDGTPEAAALTLVPV